LLRSGYEDASPSVVRYVSVVEWTIMAESK
jgi:hypothetical protein